MTLFLWKAPVVAGPDEAKALIDRYCDHGDDSAFEPTEAIGRVWDELLRLHPDDAATERPEQDSSPWANFPPDVTDRLLALDIRWSADDTVLDDIERLAREHELVLYDPQGPHVLLPTDPRYSPDPPEPPGFTAVLMAIAVTAAAALLVVVGWKLTVPVLNWLLILLGIFFLGVGGIMLYAFILIPRQKSADPEPEGAPRERG
jgi:hypothetical protein